MFFFSDSHYTQSHRSNPLSAQRLMVSVQSHLLLEPEVPAVSTQRMPRRLRGEPVWGGASGDLLACVKEQ